MTTLNKPIQLREKITALLYFLEQTFFLHNPNNYFSKFSHRSCFFAPTDKTAWSGNAEEDRRTCVRKFRLIRLVSRRGPKAQTNANKRQNKHTVHRIKFFISLCIHRLSFSFQQHAEYRASLCRLVVHGSP